MYHMYKSSDFTTETVASTPSEPIDHAAHTSAHDGDEDNGGAAASSLLPGCLNQPPSRSALALRYLLQSYTASDLHHSGTPVVELDSAMTPLDAATVLWENHILGAPVWNNVERRYVGFFDMRDILEVVVEMGGSGDDSDDDPHRHETQRDRTTRYKKIMVKRLERMRREKSRAEAERLAQSEDPRNNDGQTTSGRVIRSRHRRQGSGGPLSDGAGGGSDGGTSIFSFSNPTPPGASSASPGASSRSISSSRSSSSSLPAHDELSTIEAFASRNRFHACAPLTSLADLCNVLSLLRCHRMPVVDHGRCVSILSQSALIGFLHSHLLDAGGGGGEEEEESGECDGPRHPHLRFREDLDETLQSARLPYKKRVVSVSSRSSAADAFALLSTRKLSGIAVVDDEGRLVENTSARDIKLAALDEGRTAMSLDICTYLTTVRCVTAHRHKAPSDQYLEESFSSQGNCGPREWDPDWDGTSPVSCVPERGTTVGRVISLLAQSGYHRVFVVDDDRRPVGVVSVTDVFNFALGRDPPRAFDSDDEEELEAAGHL